MTNQDTIAAIATPSGEGGIAVIRISGPQAITIAQSCWKGANLGIAESHSAHLGTITDTDGTPLDQAVATIFRTPRSFTGEDTVELSIHGGRWLQQSVLNRIIQAGARPATAGEFSQRAFLNGRIDLAQAEGIADLIAANSHAAHRLAISQTTGSFSRKLEQLRLKLIDFAAMLELELDFSEEDVEFADRQALLQLCDKTILTVKKLTESFNAGRMYKEGIPVVIAGKPNAGKSTLLNNLLEDDLAIVSEIPGTTRDIIEATTEINGIRFRFSDTAGLHDSTEIIEQKGIERAIKRIESSSIILWLVDSTDIHSDQMPDFNIPEDSTVITVYTKVDLLNKDAYQATHHPQDPQSSTKQGDTSKIEITISAKTSEGIEELKAKISETASIDTATDDIIISNARHYSALLRAAESLRRARQTIEQGLSPVLTAMDVREATAAIAEITGQITTTDLLQTIFSHFCIGK
ncbi:MAG: tRNA uridine-5-carboxymethylaminomethyl(34) synthesis GTPase MnmE [Prevotella sp.]|nr:tRNA uridine-5-carboxymethylaminomethyl(34) synthesis GTPase MnmE [Prevotella sp.]